MSEQHLHPLTDVRHRSGKKGVLAEWDRALASDNDQALSYLRDSRLDFPTFFMIDLTLDTSMHPHLSDQQQVAHAHISNVLKGTDDGYPTHQHLCDQHHKILDTFYWMVQTGGHEFQDRMYTQVIDQAIIQLLLTYKENVLKDTVDIIFRRHRYHIHRHYLLWGLAATELPDYLPMVADYLLSSNHKDIHLAKQLLALVPGIEQARTPDEAFDCFDDWFERYHGFLEATGDNYDVSPAPIPFAINYFAQYIGKPQWIKRKQPFIEMYSLSQDFEQLDGEQQARLAHFSNQLRLHDRNRWNQWIREPLTQQLSTAGL
ncbi:hypothetical protein [Tuberibacillus sp. Marseille-P3662]|uniref:hypothetical protein n=1 Tax=Tuberibacillus sp. Marseille-P3662 TaxID=1965358 RepID=UPI000A1CA739|nr:hypothetical protein [Tuberibacillus sp. Marseille-P3662]